MCCGCSCCASGAARLEAGSEAGQAQQALQDAVGEACVAEVVQAHDILQWHTDSTNDVMWYCHKHSNFLLQQAPAWYGQIIHENQGAGNGVLGMLTGCSVSGGDEPAIDRLRLSCACARVPATSCAAAEARLSEPLDSAAEETPCLAVASASSSASDAWRQLDRVGRSGSGTCTASQAAPPLHSLRLKASARNLLLLPLPLLPQPLPPPPLLLLALPTSRWHVPVKLGL